MQVKEAELIASVCKKSFYEFVKRFWRVYSPEIPIWNWHIPYLCDEAQVMCERVFRMEKREYDQVVNICPGSTKSTIYSVMLLPWIWTRMPHAQFIGASYSYPLSVTLSSKSRSVVRSELYQACFPDIRMSEDQDAKGHFANTKGGMRFATSVGGTVTGMHGHFLVVDDPLNPQEAASEAELKVANDWMRETLPSRRLHKAVAVLWLIQQRLGQDDPSANMVKRKRVRHICLPDRLPSKVLQPPELEAKYKENKDLFDPVRLTNDDLENLKEELGNFGYSCQYRQDPVPLEGGMFITDNLKYGIPPRDWKTLIRYWDKAGTGSGQGAFTVGVFMGLDRDARFWVLDVIRARLDSFRRESLIELVKEQDGPSVTVGIEQEGGSGGKESMENTVKRLAGSRMQVDNPKGSKEMRADPFSVQVNGGNVWLKEDAPWIHEFVDEMKYFPHSKFKDQIDAASGAFAYCFKGRVRVGGIMGRLKSDQVAKEQRIRSARALIGSLLGDRGQFRVR